MLTRSTLRSSLWFINNYPYKANKPAKLVQKEFNCGLQNNHY